jgi:hypothetical protein
MLSTFHQALSIFLVFAVDRLQADDIMPAQAMA